MLSLPVHTSSPVHFRPPTPLPGFDLGKLIDAGLDADQAAEDAWHQMDDCVHASSVNDCVRAYVLKRAQLGTDGTPRSGLMTFQLGHAVHHCLERWVRAYESVEPRFELVAIEEGRRHPALPLKAKFDILGRWCGELVLFEAKSERGGCPYCKRGGQDYWRQKTAAEKGWPAPIKWDHWLQMVATSMVHEQEYGTIRYGRALYITKNDWFVEAAGVDLDDPALRHHVAQLVEEKQAAWREYCERGLLPVREDPKNRDRFWRCDTRRDDEKDGAADPRGRYCSARSVCMASNG